MMRVVIINYIGYIRKSLKTTMANPPREGQLLYHLTAVENLESILTEGLAPRSVIKNFTDVADQQIINRRIEKDLNNFVPFHFFAGSPFAGAVQRKHIDKSFVFITINRIFAKSNDFKILTQHPLSLEDCVPKSYEEGFESIDWETMNKRQYKDHNCCEICMAECLSPNIIKPSNFFSIYTKTNAINNHVTALRDKILGQKAFNVNINKHFFIP
ncbi:DarT ssDNA thymidine ADP-ribosyltransferase family protein [Pedobacter sp. UYP1]|uniref:DarT ssDNA thymidine ADP-ribosyltransferase family protein n=1 Tax=Pedobacter sp. UYP1 TaxID=1756396 RepID=UPI0033970CA3